MQIQLSYTGLLETLFSGNHSSVVRMLIMGSSTARLKLFSILLSVSIAILAALCNVYGFHHFKGHVI